MRRAAAIILGVVLAFGGVAVAQAAATYGMSLFGDLKYGPDFRHFDYVNPGAPKGGTMRSSAIGTFDTLNPYVIKGLPAAGIGMIFDTLSVASQDEPGSEYGLVAETIELTPDKLSVLYTLRKEARFPDHGIIGEEFGRVREEAELVWVLDPIDLLWRCHQGREGRRAWRSVSVQIGRQPRIAADPRADAGPLQGLLVRTRLREDDARSAARQRSI